MWKKVENSIELYKLYFNSNYDYDNMKLLKN